jgi:Mg-chelatase subunit ChlD
LVRRIAAEGAGAIDQFIREREAEGDSSIARKVQKLKEELMARAAALRERLREEFGERAEATEAEYRAKMAALERDRAAANADLERLRGSSDAQLLAALRSNRVIGLALDADVAARPPWWRRALRGLARVLRVILFPILWLLRKLFPRKAPDRVAIALPGGASFAHAGDLYLADAGFRSAVKAKLREAPTSERVRRAWERLLGREDYETLAQKAMAQMMAEEAERQKRSQSASEKTLTERLAELAMAESAAAREHDADAQRLREDEEAEARRIEEALRDAPEQEVKEAIVDELKAAGLLRETGGKLLPTLQFMDRFAALVYQDESRGAGSSRGSAGEYAEGEGHYLREPLRSAVEISRMDIPASLLRARTRHPHVRHMVEDDVVVYREERESSMHVVLIVDRSGSMEENGRMEAAKRAALALHHAVRAKNPRSQVDLLLMDTSVRRVSLKEMWEAEPRGFTNTGAALRLAREAAQRSRSGRTLVYLVTDGLPEAYTKDGEDRAGHPDKAMAYAKEQAKLLARERSVAGFVMLLLEPKDERYVKSAEALAKEGRGRVVPVDPHELARTLLKELRAPVEA